ncbi:MAG: DNA repair protein RadA [Chitinophagales bacterium]|nr:MAG: DNA repair protein RadA [Chitinophagales bacterium]
MPKVKTTYICQNCGAESPKWMGRCPSCNQWNTYVEEIIKKPQGQLHGSSNGFLKGSVAVRLDEAESLDTFRILTPDDELNRVLGGGIVPGSVVLVAGDPGIGKSTLMLQLAAGLQQATVIYISGEESPAQLGLRANRMGLRTSNCYVLAETCTQLIFDQLKALNPGLLIVDSIQTLYTQKIESSPGSVSQIRECAAELQRYAKESGVPVFLIGHITKEGMIAGPKVLEHIVDTVLQFEGDRNYNYRILRTSKNRFGSTSEIGIYDMQTSGLRQVSNPSELLLSEREELLSGITIAATMEGMRPMLIETQALVAPAVYGTPQRSSTGFDIRRLHMLLAVLEKRLGFHFGARDVFFNIAGGLKVEDPAIDLAVVCALLSSAEDTPVPYNVCFAGEVGLSGEIRAVRGIEQRIFEADKLGFEKIFIPAGNRKALSGMNTRIKVAQVSKVQQVAQRLFA